MAETALLAVAAGASVGGTALSISSAKTAQKTAGQQAQQQAANNARVVRDTQTQAAEVQAYAEQDRVTAYEAANRDAASQLKQYEEVRAAQTLEAAQEMALQQRAVVNAVSSLAAVRGATAGDIYSQTGQALLRETLAEGAADLDTLKANWGRGNRQIDTAQEAVVTQAQNRRAEADRTVRNTFQQTKNSIIAARNGATASNFQASSTAQNISNQASAQIGQAITSGARSLATTGYSYMKGA